MPPLTMMIKPVSGLCNMRCPYCFYADEMENRSTKLFEPMNDILLEKLVKRAMTYTDGQVTFAFQGGEPTLAGAEFYQKLLFFEDKYKRNNIRIHHALQTNGLNLQDDLLDVLKKGNFLLGVSLDGTKILHDEKRVDAKKEGTYDRIEKNIERIKQKGIDYNILCVVDKRIASHPVEVFENLKSHQFMQFIARLEPFSLEQDENTLTGEMYGRFLVEMFKQYKDAFYSGHPVSIRIFDNYIGMLMGMPPESCAQTGKCSVGFLVESNGDTFPCDFYALDEWKLGNIKEDSLFKMIKSKNAESFVLSSLDKNEKCVSCPYLSMCRSGCRREREGENGLTLNRLCEGYKMFFEHCLNDLKQLAIDVDKKGSFL